MHLAVTEEQRVGQWNLSAAGAAGGRADIIIVVAAAAAASGAVGGARLWLGGEALCYSEFSP